MHVQDDGCDGVLLYDGGDKIFLDDGSDGSLTP